MLLVIPSPVEQCEGRSCLQCADRIIVIQLHNRCPEPMETAGKNAHERNTAEEAAAACGDNNKNIMILGSA